MTADLKLFILAGEASGDRLAAALVHEMKLRQPVRLSGVGGSELAGEGLRSLFPMEDLSVMGFSDVAKRLPRLYWRLGQAARSALRERPDVVVLVDSQVFSAELAKRLRRGGYRGAILLYVAPAVWAWRPERAPKLRLLFDEVLSILPFEPAAMERLGGPRTTYVGHPALARLPFRSAIPERGPLLLLPGSRDGEISRTLGMMRDAALALRDHPRVTSFILPTTPAQAARLREATASWPVPVEVLADEPAKRRAFGAAIAASAVTGTVTLELALAGVPMATTYVADAGQVRRFFKYEVKFVSLPNIILDRPVVPEVLLAAPDAPKLIETIRRVLDGPGVAEAQVAAFAELRTLMEKGAPEAPLQSAADRVLARAASTTPGR
ncbi:MAG: lipid-A-disaccharide synthase [Devosia sp.]